MRQRAKTDTTEDQPILPLDSEDDKNAKAAAAAASAKHQAKSKGQIYFWIAHAIIISAMLFYFYYRWDTIFSIMSDDHYWTQAELARYTVSPPSPDPAPNSKLFLSILGQIFDVTKSRRLYGPSGAYSFFTGRDCSRAFVTGDFSESGLIDDLSDFTPGQYKSLNDWVLFYHSNYTFRGNLIGRFYDADGNELDDLKRAKEGIAMGIEQQRQEQELHLKYPRCNSKWHKDTGSAVWCSEASGGIPRDWRGHPRQMFEPGTAKYVCVCVKDSQYHHMHGNFKLYPECDENSSMCQLIS
eukprot:TRINITY_DN5436_c0_g1_i1.p1 TRINITY_DN5436_c0_g1~~TRINITY_DN5436_c0_g1_i1.p1  ORF type:complete len:297 (+),score=56.37 TRINITY_DN5436_c0_g1_i1:893-1783(+)